MSLSTQYDGKAILLPGRKGINKECIFELYLATTVSLLKSETSRPAPRN